VGSSARRRLGEIASTVDGFILTYRQPGGEVRVVLETERHVGVFAVGKTDEDALELLIERAEAFDWPRATDAAR
jgi:hypothetical protein